MEGHLLIMFDQFNREKGIMWVMTAHKDTFLRQK